MTRHLLTVLAFLSATSLAAPGVGHAQTFKVEKFDIKGDGGTDYVAVEAATGRVFVSRATHMMVVDGATGTRPSESSAAVCRLRPAGHAGSFPENHAPRR
jgi:hypothetical protein